MLRRTQQNEHRAQLPQAAGLACAYSLPCDWRLGTSVLPVAIPSFVSSAAAMAAFVPCFGVGETTAQKRGGNQPEDSS